MGWSVVIVFVIITANIWRRLQNSQIFWGLWISHRIINWRFTWILAVLIYLCLKWICLLLLLTHVFALKQFIFHSWPLFKSSCLNLWNNLLTLILIHLIWVFRAILLFWHISLAFFNFLILILGSIEIVFITVSFQYFKYFFFKILFLLKW